MSKTTTAKKTKRSRSRYPGLDKSVTLKVRQDLLDFDYLDKLSDKDKRMA
jgi:hypothetical protein